MDQCRRWRPCGVARPQSFTSSSGTWREQHMNQTLYFSTNVRPFCLQIWVNAARFISHAVIFTKWYSARTRVHHTNTALTTVWRCVGLHPPLLGQCDVWITTLVLKGRAKKAIRADLYLKVTALMAATHILCSFKRWLCMSSKYNAWCLQDAILHVVNFWQVKAEVQWQTGKYKYQIRINVCSNLKRWQWLFLTIKTFDTWIHNTVNIFSLKGLLPLIECF